jgi:hypothetical protein
MNANDGRAERLSRDLNPRCQQFSAPMDGSPAPQSPKRTGMRPLFAIRYPGRPRKMKN